MEKEKVTKLRRILPQTSDCSNETNSNSYLLPYIAVLLQNFAQGQKTALVITALVINNEGTYADQQSPSNFFTQSTSAIRNWTSDKNTGVNCNVVKYKTILPKTDNYEQVELFTPTTHQHIVQETKLNVIDKAPESTTTKSGLSPATSFVGGSSVLSKKSLECRITSQLDSLINDIESGRRTNKEFQRDAQYKSVPIDDYTAKASALKNSNPENLIEKSDIKQLVINRLKDRSNEAQKSGSAAVSQGKLPSHHQTPLVSTKGDFFTSDMPRIGKVFRVVPVTSISSNSSLTLTVTQKLTERTKIVSNPAKMSTNDGESQKPTKTIPTIIRDPRENIPATSSAATTNHLDTIPANTQNKALCRTIKPATNQASTVKTQKTGTQLVITEKLLAALNSITTQSSVTSSIASPKSVVVGESHLKQISQMVSSLKKQNSVTTPYVPSFQQNLKLPLLRHICLSTASVTSVPDKGVENCVSDADIKVAQSENESNRPMTRARKRALEEESKKQKEITEKMKSKMPKSDLSTAALNINSKVFIKPILPNHLKVQQGGAPTSNNNNITPSQVIGTTANKQKMVWQKAVLDKLIRDGRIVLKTIQQQTVKATQQQQPTIKIASAGSNIQYLKPQPSQLQPAANKPNNLPPQVIYLRPVSATPPSTQQNLPPVTLKQPSTIAVTPITIHSNLSQKQFGNIKLLQPNAGASQCMPTLVNVSSAAVSPSQLPQTYIIQNGKAYSVKIQQNQHLLPIKKPVALAANAGASANNISFVPPRVPLQNWYCGKSTTTGSVEQNNVSSVNIYKKLPSQLHNTSGQAIVLYPSSKAPSMVNPQFIKPYTNFQRSQPFHSLSQARDDEISKKISLDQLLLASPSRKPWLFLSKHKKNQFIPHRYNTSTMLELLGMECCTRELNDSYFNISHGAPMIRDPRKYFLGLLDKKRKRPAQTKAAQSLMEAKRLKTELTLLNAEKNIHNQVALPAVRLLVTELVDKSINSNNYCPDHVPNSNEIKYYSSVINAKIVNDIELRRQNMQIKIDATNITRFFKSDEMRLGQRSMCNKPLSSNLYEPKPLRISPIVPSSHVNIKNFINLCGNSKTDAAKQFIKLNATTSLTCSTAASSFKTTPAGLLRDFSKNMMQTASPLNSLNKQLILPIKVRKADTTMPKGEKPDTILQREQDNETRLEILEETCKNPNHKEDELDGENHKATNNDLLFKTNIPRSVPEPIVLTTSPVKAQ